MIPPAVFRSGRTGKPVTPVRESLAQDLAKFEQFLSMPEPLTQPKVTEVKSEPQVIPQPKANDIVNLWTKLKV
jgi:hypothetical protein